jgi:flagellar basal body-associated protein FliL
LITIAAFVISAIAVIVIIALWIKSRQHKEKDETNTIFNCSITDKGKDPNTTNSVDVYDCVEADEKDAKTSPKD